MRSQFVAIATVCVVANTAPAAAQSARPQSPPHTVQPGDRVRLTPNNSRTPTLTGSLLEVRGDTLFVVRDGASGTTTSVVGSQLASIERSVGRRSRTLEGGILGALAGGVVGIVVGVATYEPPAPPVCQPGGYFCLNLDFGPDLNIVGGALVGGGVGLIVGAIIGSDKSTDRWQRIGLGNGPFELRVSNSGLGARAGLALPFGSAPPR